jgi:hypothetical protein
MVPKNIEVGRIAASTNNKTTITQLQCFAGQVAAGAAQVLSSIENLTWGPALQTSNHNFRHAVPLLFSTGRRHWRWIHLLQSNHRPA